MKKLLLTTMAVLLLMSGAQAQTKLFAGANYDEEVAVSMGFATPLFGTPVGEVWEFSYVNFGVKHYKSLTSEFAVLRTSEDKKIYGGVLLGGNGEWISGENPTMYLVGASGFIGGYQNFYGYVKYKFALEGGTLYPDGLAGGFGVHIKL